MTGSAFGALKRHTRSLLVGLGVLPTVMFGGTDTCEPPDYSAAIVNLPSPPCPCTASQLADWERIDRFPHHVVGTVPTDSVLDHYVAGGDIVHSWKPIFPAKTIMCGHVDHVHYQALEGDWNLFVVPSPGSQFSHDFLMARELMDPENLGILLECGSGKVECLEVESAPYAGPSGISPVKSWFEPSPRSEVCAYAPFVQDVFHGGKPESHPADLLWWSTDERESLSLMVLEDGDRFGSRDNFQPPPPDDWHPWAEDPRKARFRRTFKVGASEAPKTLTVHEVEHFQVETERHLGADPHKTHTLQSNGAVRLTVVKEQFEPKRLKVSFGGVCATTAGDLQGYVILDTAVGRPEHISGANEFWRGYQVLRLADSASPQASFRSSTGGERPSAVDYGSALNVVTQTSPAAPPEPAASSRSLWLSLVRAAGTGGRAEDILPRPERMMSVRRWQVTVIPRTEESGAHAFERLMREPLTLSWSFEARNLVTGTKADVVTTRSRDASDSAVRVVLSAYERLPDGQAEVIFPGDLDEAMYELTVSIVARAAERTSSPVRRRVWSHVVPGDYDRSLVERMLGAESVQGLWSTENVADDEVKRKIAEGDPVFKAEWLLASTLRQREAPFLTVNDVGRLLRLTEAVRAARARRGER